jgi:hypothetical protein
MARNVSRRTLQWWITGAVAAGLFFSTSSAGAANLAANGSFDAPSGAGSTGYTETGNGGISTAADWIVFNDTRGTTTQQAPFTLVPGGTELLVSVTGASDGIVQTGTLKALNKIEHACIWVFVQSGAVMVGPGNGGLTTGGAAILKQNSSEVPNVTNNDLSVNEFVIYSYNGPASFAIESESLGASRAQCKPK